MGGDAKLERERRWRRHLAGWQASGLSQAAYCRQQGLTQNDFSWWKRELARRDQSTVRVPAAFVPVRISPPHATAAAFGFELSLRDGRVLRFDGCVDPAALGAVVRVLEAADLQPGAGPC